MRLSGYRKRSESADVNRGPSSKIVASSQFKQCENCGGAGALGHIAMGRINSLLPVADLRTCARGRGTNIERLTSNVVGCQPLGESAIQIFPIINATGLGENVKCGRRKRPKRQTNSRVRYARLSKPPMGVM
jgi:hypothetical protein